MTPLLCLLLAAAVYRLTVLVVYDNVWDGTRARIMRWSERGPCGCDEVEVLGPWPPPAGASPTFEGCPDALPGRHRWGRLWPLARTGRVLRTKTADLLGCAWCVSWWLAGFTALAYEAWGPTEPAVIELAAAALAWSAFTGIVAERVNVLTKRQQEATEAAADAWAGQTQP